MMMIRTVIIPHFDTAGTGRDKTSNAALPALDAVLGLGLGDKDSILFASDNPSKDSLVTNRDLVS